MDLVSRFYREEEPLRRLVRSLAANPQALALDVGCKEGDVSEALAPLVGRLVALDPVWSDAWVRRQGSLRFVRGDALHLPFRDASFDVVVAAECLQYVRDARAALDEFGRVLKAGGVLVLSFPEAGPAATWLDPYNLTKAVKRIVRPGAARSPFVHHLRARSVLEHSAARWRRREHLRRGTPAFIYLAWSIDKLQLVRRELAGTRGALRPVIRLLFRLMRADFRLALGFLSYNNVIRLERRS